MTTFEERYRRKAVSVPSPLSETKDPGAMELLQDAAKDEYKAYNAVAHPETDLWIRTGSANKNADVILPYSYRNHMIYDGSGFLISMHFSTPIISVTLHGRNLQELLRKLTKREVEWVMEFDPKKWGELSADAAYISKIEIKRAPIRGAADNDDDAAGKQSFGSKATH
jgi:hypothetical protein